MKGQCSSTHCTKVQNSYKCRMGMETQTPQNGLTKKTGNIGKLFDWKTLPQ